MNCEKTHEPAPTVLTIHAPGWERRFLHCLIKIQVIFLWLGQNNFRQRVLLVHWRLVEEKKAVGIDPWSQPTATTLWEPVAFWTQVPWCWMLPVQQHSLKRPIWPWQRTEITRIPLLNVGSVSPFLSQGTGLQKDSWRYCIFLDSVNFGMKGVFLVLAMGGKHSDNFSSDNCSTHNKSLSHMFSFGLQSTLFTLSSQLISLYILCTL